MYRIPHSPWLSGAVDWRVKDHILIRAAQADYFYTKHDFSYGAAGIATHQNNFRVSAGIVYLFGGQRTTVAGRAHAAKRIGNVTMPIPILGLLVSNRVDGEGAQIAEVISGGVASFSGLRVGDVINAVDGKPVRSPMELAAVLSDRPSGTKVLLGVDADRSTTRTRLEHMCGTIGRVAEEQEVPGIAKSTGR